MLPGFTAQASLYRSGGRYAGSLDAAPGPSVALAYFPGPATQARCSSCTSNCASNLAICSALAAVPLVACVFPPACPFAAAAAGAALAACNATSLVCLAKCELTSDCCPKRCGPGNPFDPGDGCCDDGEHCVSRGDPNSRQGCCPSDRAVCGGRCCDAGHSCCGDTCCPPGYFCREGGFCSQFPSDLLPPPGTPPPPPPQNNCIFGGAPCGTKCCPPGLQCCNVVQGQPVCATSCLH